MAEETMSSKHNKDPSPATQEQISKRKSELITSAVMLMQEAMDLQEQDAVGNQQDLVQTATERAHEVVCEEEVRKTIQDVLKSLEQKTTEKIQDILHQQEVARRMQEVVTHLEKKAAEKIRAAIHEHEQQAEQRIHAATLAHNQQKKEIQESIQVLQHRLQAVQEALRTQKNEDCEILERVRRLEERVETMEQRLESRLQQERTSGVDRQLDLLHLGGRVHSLEASLQRTLEVFFPRVESLVAQMQKQTSVSISAAICAGSLPSKHSDVSPTDFFTPGDSLRSLTTEQRRELYKNVLTDPNPRVKMMERFLARFPMPLGHRPFGPPAAKCASPQPLTPEHKALGEDLLKAVAEGREDDVRSLLDAGADIETVNMWNQTPLMLAAENGDAIILLLLLDRGANVNAKLDGWTALHEAAWTDLSGQCVSLLINARADLESKDAGGHRPLHMAAARDNEEAVKLLLKFGANKSAVTNQGKAPVDYAHREAVCVLLTK